MKVLAAVLFALFAHGVAAQPGSARPDPLTALVNVTLIDGHGGAPRPAMTVLIQGARIVDVRASTAGVPDGAIVVDLDGHYLIPGMFDTHTHLTNPDIQHGRARVDRDLKRLLYAGVTTIRDMAGDARLVATVKRDLLLDRIVGPEIHYTALFAGPAFNALDPRVGPASIGYPRGTAPWQQTADADTDVEHAITRAIETGATGIKFYVDVDAPVMRALADEARRRGLKVWAHGVVFPDRPMVVVQAGVDVVSHLCSLVWEDRNLDPAVSVPYRHLRPPANPRPTFDPARIEADSPEMIALFAEMSRRGTLIDATYSAYRGPEDRNCAPPLMTAIAKGAHRAGIRLSTGTDWFTPDDDPFPSVTVEIERLVEGGILTPDEAITAATLNGARATGLEDSHGTIESGKVANLAVLRENPVEDIHAVRSVVTVYRLGRPYPRAEYRP
ncbi:MAG: amidohydrolase family protein [Gammaproteobacteria bacterium]